MNALLLPLMRLRSMRNYISSRYVVYGGILHVRNTVETDNRLILKTQQMETFQDIIRVIESCDIDKERSNFFV